MTPVGTRVLVKVTHRDAVFWNAHRYVCDRRATDENSWQIYHHSPSTLFIQWWWEELGVVLHHEVDTSHLYRYNIRMEFPTEEEWQMFLLRWV